MKLEFGPWLPDLPDLDNPGCVEAKNCLPINGAYTPLKSLQTFSSALTSKCLGAFTTIDGSGDAQNFAGDVDTLYQLNSALNYARINTASYSLAVAWDFTQLGDRVVACDANQAPQYFDLASSTKFADLAGSPPKAAHCAVVREFLVLGNLENARSTVRWSGYNNSELWTTSLATQAGSQNLQGQHGDVQYITSGEFGLVFMEHAIYRMDYVGPPVIFEFDLVERRLGTPAPFSVVQYGGLTYFYEWSGFYVTDGRTTQRIGSNKVDKWFYENAATLSFSTMVGALDRENEQVVWSFTTVNNSSNNDRLIIYSISDDSWSWAEVDTQWLVERVAPATSLDGLDTPLPNGIDIDSISVDSPLYQGGQINISAFDSSNRASLFSGTPYGATIITKEVAIDEHHSETRAVRPLVADIPSVEKTDPSVSITAQIGHRNALTSDVTFTDTISLNSRGEADKMLNARYQRYRLNISNGYKDAIGVDVRGRKAGRR